LPNGLIAPFNVMTSQAANGAFSRTTRFQVPNGPVFNNQFTRTPPQGPNGQATFNRNSSIQFPNGLVAQLNAMVARSGNGAINRTTQLQLPDGTTLNKQFNRTAPQGPNGQVTTTAQLQVTGNPNSPFLSTGIGPFNAAVSPFMLTSNPYASAVLSRAGAGAGYSSYGGYSPMMGYGGGMAQGSYGNQSGNYANQQQQPASQVSGEDAMGYDKTRDKGQLDWPLALRILPDPETGDLRKEVETLLQAARGQANSGSKVQQQLIGKAERDINRLGKLLNKSGPALPVSDYAVTESRRFLKRLKDVFNSL